MMVIISARVTTLNDINGEGTAVVKNPTPASLKAFLTSGVIKDAYEPYIASGCHSGLSGIFLGFSEGFPTRFACGNDRRGRFPMTIITPVVCETLH